MDEKFPSQPIEAVSNLIRTTRNADGSGGFLVAEISPLQPKAMEYAQLFAAAPELLEALEGVANELGIDWLRPEFDGARAAIAKATGGQP